MADPVEVQVSGTGLVVGPDDVLVISLGGGSLTRAGFELATDLMGARIPALKDRILVVAAEQLAVIQGAREPT